MIAFRLRIAAIAVAAVSALTSVAPAQAFQMPSAPKIAAQSDVTNVQFMRGERHWGGPRWGERRGWYRGHRGYRYERPGYRYHNGYWFPLAAFGAVIGGAIAADRGGYSSRHVAWCESRYRTYRASDDTYVPRAGVRARCVSPY